MHMTSLLLCFNFFLPIASRSPIFVPEIPWSIGLAFPGKSFGNGIQGLEADMTAGRADSDSGTGGRRDSSSSTDFEMQSLSTLSRASVPPGAMRRTCFGPREDSLNNCESKILQNAVAAPEQYDEIICAPLFRSKFPRKLRFAQICAKVPLEW